MTTVVESRRMLNATLGSDLMHTIASSVGAPSSRNLQSQIWCCRRGRRDRITGLPLHSPLHTGYPDYPLQGRELIQDEPLIGCPHRAESFEFGLLLAGRNYIHPAGGVAPEHRPVGKSDDFGAVEMPERRDDESAAA